MHPTMTPPVASTLNPSARDAMAALLADGQWVRALARTLAVDADEADDLAQDACLLALRRPPVRADNLRGWFQRVLQNLLRQRRRAAGRRVQRERATEMAAETAAVDDLVSRAATHRAVVDAVLRLDEPYRATVLLRFFEDLPPRAIAARMGVPVATVNTRLQRGFARLRARLDSDFGDRRAWCAALLPLPRLAATLTFLEVLLMNGKALALGASLVVGALALWFGAGVFSPAPPPPVTGASPVALEKAGDPAPAVRDGEARDAAAARTAVASPPAVPTPQAAPSRRLDGRIVDAEGRALPAVKVVLESGSGVAHASTPRATSDPRGGFAMVADPSSEGRITIDDGAWRTVMFAAVRAGEPPRLALVVGAPRLALAGHVRSAEGRPLAGAIVQVVWPADLRTRLSDISDAATEEVVVARTAADATFRLDAARVRGAELVTTAEGFLPDRRPVPDASDGALEITLLAPRPQPGMLQGQVVDARGAPVADARVALGEALERSDAQGRFLIADDGKSALLSAALVGHRRGTLARPDRGFAGFVTLTLGAAPLTIGGRVLDGDGRGLPDIRVWALDPTLLSRRGELLLVEGVSAGCTTMDVLRERYRRGELSDPERTLRETATASWPWVRTGADGAFTLGGLEDRPYRLRAMDDRTVLMVDSDPVPAGSTGVVIRVRSEGLFGELRGQVVSRSGVPVPDARVHVQVDTQSLAGTTMHGRALAVATSDAEGRFELKDVPKENAYLRLEGEGILPVEYGRGAPGGLLVLTNGDVRNVRVEVCVRMHVQVELSDPETADELAVHDAGGEAIMINVFRGRSRSETDTLAFAAGKTPVFVVPDTATTLFLRKGGKEVRREALQLRPGDVNVLRY